MPEALRVERALPVPVAATFTFQFIQPSSTFSILLLLGLNSCTFHLNQPGGGFVTPVARADLAATINLSAGTPLRSNAKRHTIP